MELYREEEIFWLDKDNKPFQRMSKVPTGTEIAQLQIKFPHSSFTLRQETRSITTLRTYEPAQKAA